MSSLITKLAFKVIPKPHQSVFICGCGHTGTTLLARILSTHPDIYSVPYETGAFLGKNSINLSAIILFVRARKSRKTILVEKTPRHIHHIEQIRHHVPGAKFIVATRDGRDVVASLGKRYGNFNKAFKRWQKDTRKSIQSLSSPDTTLWRYEDFIDNPQLSLQQICQFIDAEYKAELLNYHQNPIDWGKKEKRGKDHRELRNTQVNEPIIDNRGKWQTSLPKDYSKLFLNQTSQELANALGYNYDDS